MHILVDIGGTNMRVAKTEDRERFSDPLIIKTPPVYAEGSETLSSAIRTVAAGVAVESVIVGIRGSVSQRDGTTHDIGAIKDWSLKPIRADLGSAAATSAVFLENDTALVGLGEATFGAGVNASIVAYVTVSTGLNGVRVVDGWIDKTAQGFEIGGQYLNTEGTTSLEDLVSGTAIEKKYGKPPKELGTGSPVWEEEAKILAIGLHNTILHWSPERVVLGGSMFNDIGINVDRVAVRVKEVMNKFQKTPEIVHSKLGDLGGLWGGL